MNELKRYFDIARRLSDGKEVLSEDIEFFLSYTPEVDEAKMRKLVEGGDFSSFEEAQAAITEAARALQSTPEYKESVLQIAQDAEGKRLTEKFAQGVNIVLAGSDIATSINQISQANKAAKRSKRPARPSIPRRDLMLQQALRSAEEGTFDTQRALAPVQQEIQDQYLADVQNAKTASTGQAGAYGAYRQIAANRRNRAAMQLAPIADQIRAREQARYDNLLNMRAQETQNMFENQASLYPYDLQQYQNEQNRIDRVGALGRYNLRGSLYNLGNQAAGFAGSEAARRRFERLRNRALIAGVDPDIAEQADKNVRGYLQTMTIDDTPEYWNQMY